MTLPWNVPDPAYDATATTLTQAVDALAAMIGAVLAPYGLDPRYSHRLPPEQVPLSPDSGPVVVHVGGSDAPIPVGQDIYDSCLVTLQYTVKSYYFIVPLTTARADAWEATQAWLLPVLRALFANTTLGGTVAQLTPQTVEWVGEMPYGADHTGTPFLYTGFIVTSHVWVNYQMEIH